MSVEFYRSMWGPMGFDGNLAPLAGVCEETRKRGYIGIETNPVLWGDNVAEGLAVVADHGLRFLPRAHTFGSSVDSHVKWARSALERSAELGMPHVIVQSGADWFSDAEIDEYFTASAALEAEFGVRIAHETHRGCILYSPWVTARVLDRFPDIWLASDYSHWVIVAERFLETEGAILERCAARMLHIDARVGDWERPQVEDPRDEEAAPALAAFDGWWDAIHVSAVARGDVLTVVPEFGPPPYEPKNAGDRDDICQWMIERLAARWSA